MGVYEESLAMHAQLKGKIEVISRKTITTREELKEWLRYEHRVYGNVSWLKTLLSQGEKAILWKHQKLLRKAEYYLNTRKGLLLRLTRFRLLKLQSRYAIHIPSTAAARGGSSCTSTRC